MSLEVELKFRVDDLRAVETRATALGGQFGAAETQIDHYFNHPLRDFAQTDEALRLRAVGDDVRVTYKGPKLDKTTKTRREIELPIASADGPATVEQWTTLLTALGFRSVAQVRKQRREAMLVRDGRTLHVTLDEVERVGTFAEVETIAEDHEREAAIASVHALAGAIGLTTSERRSYLEMLLTAEPESESWSE